MEFYPPNDWDNESWRCVEILWPDSPKYIALLNGLLSQLQFAKMWAGTQAQVQTAQEIAWSIWWANQPFTDCATQPPDVPTIPPIGPLTPIGGGMAVEELEMPCIDISNLLKIEGSTLYARDACCEWVAIGNLAAVSEPITDPFADPENPPDYSACGKAASVLEITQIVGEAVWDCLALSVNQWVGHVKAAAPGWHLGTPQIYYAVGRAQIVSLIHGENQVFAADMLDQMQCTIEQFFTADGQGVSQDSFTAIKGAIKSVWATVNKSSIGDLWVNFMDVLGLTDISNAAIAGATDVSADCTCPEPGGLGDVIWLNTYEIGRNDGNTPTFVRSNGGRTVSMTWNTGDEQAFQALEYTLHFDTAIPLITQLKLRVEGTHMLDTWHESGDCPADERDEWAIPTMAENQLNTTEPGAGQKDFEFIWNAPGVDLNTKDYHLVEGRACHRNVVNRQYEWTITITEVNGSPV